MSTPPYAEILAGRGILLLEKVDARSFTASAPWPDWFRLLAPTGLVPGQAFEPGAVFLFLDHFLEDAAAFWTGSGDGELQSGSWAETVASGEDLQFEAVACKSAGNDYLVIRRLTTGFAQLHGALQKGRELSLAHERLVEEIGKKEILLHCIIHDISGPLQGMSGALQLAQRDEQPENVRRLIDLGLLAAKQQGNLIRDLLDTFRSEVTSVETLAADPATAPDVVACANAVIESLQPAFAIRSLKCAVLPPGDAHRVVAARNRLERVFYNLLQNAMRHSPRGGTVRVSLREEEGFVRVAVEDEGPGISPEVVPQLFQKFVRQGSSGGKAGLGLFFCRITIEQWGGSIGCEPRAGGGTVFWFRLKKV